MLAMMATMTIRSSTCRKLSTSLLVKRKQKRPYFIEIGWFGLVLAVTKSKSQSLKQATDTGL